MGEADFTGGEVGGAAEQARVAGRVMRAASTIRISPEFLVARAQAQQIQPIAWQAVYPQAAKGRSASRWPNWSVIPS